MKISITKFSLIIVIIILKLLLFNTLHKIIITSIYKNISKKSNTKSLIFG